MLKATLAYIPMKNNENVRQHKKNYCQNKNVILTLMSLSFNTFTSTSQTTERIDTATLLPGKRDNTVIRAPTNLFTGEI